MRFLRILSACFLLAFIFVLAGCPKPAQQPPENTENTSVSQTESVAVTEPHVNTIAHPRDPNDPDYMLFPIYLIQEGQKLFGFIDKQGNMIVEPFYFSARDFKEGLAPVQVKVDNSPYWGFINLDGVEVVEPVYSIVGDFKEGLASVATLSEDDDMPLWGFIDKEGNVAVEIKWEQVHDFSDGRAFVYQDGASHFINSSGAIVIDNADGYIDFLDGLSPKWNENGETTYIDPSGVVVLTIQYDRTRFFSEGRSPVKKDGKWGFIDKQGNLVIPAIYDSVTDFTEDVAFVSVDNKWKCLDIDGNIIFETDLLPAGPFADGLAPVVTEVGQPVGFIDKTGKIVIAPMFTEQYGFHDGLAFVRVQSTYGYIDHSGEFVWQGTEETGVVAPPQE